MKLVLSWLIFVFAFVVMASAGQMKAPAIKIEAKSGITTQEKSKGVSKKSKIPKVKKPKEMKKGGLAVICFFLGFLGIHRFIMKRPLTGVIMLLTLGCGGLWVLIDFILILTGDLTYK